MRNWILISMVMVALAAGTLRATEPDAKELAAKGYSAFKNVLEGDVSKLAEPIGEISSVCTVGGCPDARRRAQECPS